MTGQWWSWLLSAMGVAGIWLAGSRKRSGWAIGLVSEVVWIAYAVLTRQYGFILGALAYGFVQVRNWLAWSDDGVVVVRRGEVAK